MPKPISNFKCFNCLTIFSTKFINCPKCLGVHSIHMNIIVEEKINCELINFLNTDGEKI